MPMTDVHTPQGDQIIQNFKPNIIFSGKLYK